jgi:hypothetical protein
MHGQARILIALRYRSASRHGASEGLCKPSHGLLPSALDPTRADKYTEDVDIREMYAPPARQDGTEVAAPVAVN